MCFMQIACQGCQAAYREQELNWTMNRRACYVHCDVWEGGVGDVVVFPHLFSKLRRSAIVKKGWQ